MDDATRALIERAVGPIRAIEDRSWPERLTTVWRVEAGGEIVWVKQHRAPRKHAQELRAYRDLVPRLAAAGLRVPALVASDGVLVLSHVPGEPARDDDPALHHQAGEALRILHDLPLADDDPVPVRAALRARLDRWLADARGQVEDALLAQVVRGFGAGMDGARCWCHRDYQARNWLCDAGRLGIIDFERAAPDLPPFDFAKLAEVASPEAYAALVAGYGRDPGPDLARVLWLTGLSTIVWSRRHGDAAYEAVGRRLLARLAEQEGPSEG